MSTLKVRKIDFRFEKDILLQWNQGNPYIGNCGNIATFIAPAFERYFVKAMREAMPLIKKPEIHEEAVGFCAQEGQHSKQHFAHTKLLTSQYSGLGTLTKKLNDSYDKLLAEHDLKFHLAYMTNLELLFTPTACFVLKNVERLFGDSDARITSFMLWHLVEEVEHRSSAKNVYDEVVGNHWYRIRHFPAMVRHLTQLGTTVKTALMEHVPARDNVIAHDDLSGTFKGTRGKLAFIWQLLDTLLPTHNPDKAAGIDWAEQWLIDEEAGRDMTLYYPQRSTDNLTP